MKITPAGISVFMWGLFMLAAVAGAALAGAKAGWRGWPVWVRMLPGALLLLGFVSGIIGLYELNNYVATFSFWISINVGIVGAWLFGSGAKQLGQMFK